MKNPRPARTLLATLSLACLPFSDAFGQSAGSLDPSFADPGLNGGTKIVVQADGKVIVTGGTVIVASGIKNAVRLNEDGTIDPSYDVPGSGISDLVQLPDGRSLVSGVFAALGTHTTRNLAILRTDGSPDTNFVAKTLAKNSGPVSLVTLLDGGGAYVGWSAGDLYRINLDGSTNGTFVPTSLGSGYFFALAVQSSGKLLVDQSGKIFRLNPDGTRDAGYTETTFGTTGLPQKFALAADGSLFVGGATATVNGDGFRTLIKLKPDGGLDPAFKFGQDGTAAADKTVSALALQADGKLLVSLVSENLLRVLPDGTTDPAFTTPAKAPVLTLDRLGRIVANGFYFEFSPTVVFRIGTYRLFNDGAPEKPIVTGQPANLTVNSGEDAVFAVAAAGAPPLSYHWQFNGTDIPGASSNRLVLPAVTSAQAGEYRAVVTSPKGTATSSIAKLTVDGKPKIKTQPQSLTGSTGDSLKLTAVATGEAPLVFQWFHDQTPVPGASMPTLAFPSLAKGDAGDYVFVASNTFGSTTSSVVHLSVYTSLPGWLVVTNVTTATTFTNLDNPFRPDGATRIVQDGPRGIVALYAGGVERWNDAGERLWSVRYIDVVDSGALSALAVDHGGNTFVSGIIHYAATLGDLTLTNNSGVTGPNGHQQAFIAKLDPAGHALWYRLYEAAGPRIWSLAVDTDGGVVFAGVSGGRNGQARLGSLVTAESEYAGAAAGKLATDGTPQWFKIFPQFAVNRSTCEAESVTADETGIYLSGLISFSMQFGAFQLQQPGPSQTHWIGKLTSGGEPQWIKPTGGQPAQFSPLMSGGGQRWFLLMRDRVLQSWSADGTILTNFSAVPFSQNDSAQVAQLAVTAAGEPVLVGSAKGSANIGTNSLNVEAGRPFLWYGQWDANGVFCRGRLLATTTNANPNLDDSVAASSFNVSPSGDVYLAGSFVNGLQFLGRSYGAPVGSVNGRGLKSGAFLAKIWQPDLLPEVTRQPIAAYTLDTGDSVKIGLQAAGPGPLTYQWRQNGVPVADKTTNTIEFVNAAFAINGNYDCVVTNPYGSVISEIAVITVRPPFKISTQPAGQLVLVGGMIVNETIDPLVIDPGAIANKQLVFTITNTTSARFPLNGQFTLDLNGSSVGGNYTRLAGVFPARSDSYQTVYSIGTGADSTGLRFVQFSGIYMALIGLRLHGGFDLDLEGAPDGCCATGTFTVGGGTNRAVFKVQTTSFVPDGNYQWQKNRVDLPRKTASRLDLTDVTAADAGFYSCVITYRNYTETSQPAELRVIDGGTGSGEPPPLTFVPLSSGATELSFPQWPAGYILQRTPTLSPAVWETFATAPPVSVPINQSGAYFRLAPKP